MRYDYDYAMGILREVFDCPDDNPYVIPLGFLNNRKDIFHIEELIRKGLVKVILGKWLAVSEKGMVELNLYANPGWGKVRLILRSILRIFFNNSYDPSSEIAFVIKEEKGESDKKQDKTA